MMVRKTRAGRWELRVRHRLLPRDFYASFDTEDEAREYGGRLEALLAKGIVVPELFPNRAGADPMLSVVIRDYTAGAVLPPARAELLDVLRGELDDVRLSAVSYRWAEGWVASMKRKQRLAPGTIRKRVSALAIALDAYHRRAEKEWANPLRMLPRGYSTYTEADALELAKKGEAPKVDVSRDRRLGADEEQRIRAALAGEKRPDRERALDLPHGDALAMLFDLVLETGMRLREAYSLRVDQVDLERSTINVQGSKAKVGSSKPRQVPIKPTLRPRLAAYLQDRVGLIFPFWNGDPEDLRRATSNLSRAFGRLFEYAQCPDLTEHDLRHEACCRWLVLRNSRGGWMFSDIEICKIMGWTDPKMMLRYASLRGSDLAARFNE
jgi:integrase